LNRLRAYLAWAQKADLIAANPADAITSLPTNGPSPKSIPSAVVDALLRTVQSKRSVRLHDRPCSHCWPMPAYAPRRPATSSCATSTWMG